ncbi:MAG TPA: hypothetical protein DIT55_05725, partial [Spirochaetaceae bacterium]|nr:hypothetical protein [Spirochaetaceae bacterium]
MRIETERTEGSKDALAESAFRSKPFLTILDGKPGAAGRGRRHSHRPIETLSANPATPQPRFEKPFSPSPSSAMRKNGVKLKAYAEEGIRKALFECKAGI